MAYLRGVSVTVVTLASGWVSGIKKSYPYIVLEVHVSEEIAR